MKYQKPQYNKNQKGFTLLELLISLAVIAALIGGVIMLTGQAQGSANAKKTGDNLLSIYTGVKSLYQTPNFTTLGTTGSTGEQLLINSGKAPSVMVNGTGATAT